MFTPNHVVVTVASARNLPSRGKTGKNFNRSFCVFSMYYDVYIFLCLAKLDAFVVIQLNETKFQTSIKQKTLAPVWEEECEL